MIVKLREPLKWKKFKANAKDILAIQMREDFMFETKNGWEKGYKGQWLVEIGENMRFVIDDESFKRQYRPAEEPANE
jgi:hypothetical protein